MSKRQSKAGAPAEWPASQAGKISVDPERKTSQVGFDEFKAGFEKSLDKTLDAARRGTAAPTDNKVCPKCGFNMKRNGECTVCATKCYVCGHDLPESGICVTCQAQRDHAGR